MACKKYIYAAGDTTWVTTFMEAIERSWRGLNSTSLTDWIATTSSSIAEGSIFEVAGSVYIATSDTSIIGTVTTGVNYISAVGSATGAVFALTTTVPIWRNDYQGFYSSTTSTIRILGGVEYKGTSYNNKWVYNVPTSQVQTKTGNTTSQLKYKTVQMGDWDMDATTTLNVDHGISDFQKIRSVQTLIRRDDQVALYPLDYHAVGTSAGYILSITVDKIALVRTTGGIWDSIDYDSTSFNRGYVMIWYEE